MMQTPNIAIAEIPDNEAYAPLANEASLFLSDQVYHGDVSAEEVRRNITIGHTIVAMSEGKGLIGAGLLVANPNNKVGSVTAVAVSPEHRGQGIGTEIIAELEKVAKDQNLEKLIITPTSQEAKELYQKLGYQVPYKDSLTLVKLLSQAPADAPDPQK